jgi:predicted DNA-binding ribbon-helix-helix protein
LRLSRTVVTALIARISYDNGCEDRQARPCGERHLATGGGKTRQRPARVLRLPGHVRGNDRVGRQAAGRRRLSGLIKRSFSLAGHRTSVALEDEFWAALTHIAAERSQTLTALVAATDAERDPARPLASALRVLALSEFFSRQLTSS